MVVVEDALDCRHIAGRRAVATEQKNRNTISRRRWIAGRQGERKEHNPPHVRDGKHVPHAPVAAQRSPQLDGDGVAELRPDHLRQLESEAIYVMRETAGQFQKTVLLFSGGKDSAVMVRLAEKAFRPARAPFTLLHIDTG